MNGRLPLQPSAGAGPAPAARTVRAVRLARKTLLATAMLAAAFLVIGFSGAAFAHGSPLAHEEPSTPPAGEQQAEPAGSPDQATGTQGTGTATEAAEPGTPAQPEQPAEPAAAEAQSPQSATAPPGGSRGLSPVAAVVLGTSAALFPVLAGLLLALRSHGWTGRARAGLDGAVVGVLLFLFVDFLSLTANLGIGLKEVAGQVLFLALFSAGMIGLALGEGGARGLQPGAAGSGGGLERRVAYLWALGIGFHTLGEGLIMGYNLHLGLGAALKVLPLLSFVLHKLAEGVSVAALLRGERPAPATLVGMSLVAGLPAVPGVLMGFLGLPGAISNYFYALGAGALVYVLPKFFRARAGEPDVTKYIGIAAGIVFMYLAALLHEV